MPREGPLSLRGWYISEDRTFELSLFDEVRSEGIEIEVQSVNIDAGDFKWSTNFNITFQNSEVLSLPGGGCTVK